MAKYENPLYNPSDPQPDGRYRVRKKLPNPATGEEKLFPFYGETYDEAYKKCCKAVDNANKGLRIGKIPLVRAYVDEYINTYLDGLSPLYRGNLIAELDRFCNGVKESPTGNTFVGAGKKQLDAVKPEDIKKFYNTRKGQSPSTNRHMVVAVRGFFNAALDNGYSSAQSKSRDVRR